MCALVTGVQTCALPILAPGVGNTRDRGRVTDSRLVVTVVGAPEGIELAEQVSLLVAVLRRAQPVDGIGAGAVVDLQHLAAEPVDRLLPGDLRSEEHTSELQSLMRTSYAVFCLKEKQNQQSSST